MSHCTIGYVQTGPRSQRHESGYYLEIHKARAPPSSLIGPQLSHLPNPGSYFLNRYSLNPVTSHLGLVLKRRVKESALTPD